MISGSFFYRLLFIHATNVARGAKGEEIKHGKFGYGIIVAIHPSVSVVLYV
jgi:hypothetical protein